MSPESITTVEITMISVSGNRARVSRISVTPCPSGNCKSVSSTFGALSASAARASASVPAARTWYPALPSASCSRHDVGASSSTRRMVVAWAGVSLVEVFIRRLRPLSPQPG